MSLVKMMARCVCARPQRNLSGMLVDSNKTNQRPDEVDKKLPTIHLKVTSNNTILTITDESGLVKGWTSAGAEGFKNSRRGTTFAAQAAGVSAARKALKMNYHSVKVKINGISQFRQAALKGLEEGGLNVTVIQDVTPIPHNGSRPRKARRL